MTDSRSMNAAPNIIRLAEYERFPYAVESVDLTFDLHATKTRVTQISVWKKITTGVTSLELNGKDLKRISVKIDGELVDESRLVEIDESLLIRQVPDAFTLEVVTQINPEANTALEGLYLSNGMF
ncbi:MAG TPA: aminopeptidase N, partial [Gammaproteobacteria bacterium]|nr:aminopeptidase N [Gammaproteobacteria bacterium]